jgi:polysaccharide biosynthesis/export protein
VLMGLAGVMGRRYVLVCVVLGLFLHRTAPVSAQVLPLSPTSQQSDNRSPKSVIGTAEETNDRIHQLGTQPKSGAHDYTIGNGDVLSIFVFDVAELSRDVRVSQSGTIGLPLVPARIHVAGLTETQAQQVIADVLQSDGLVSHPEVSVTVKEHKSRPITVVGAVAHPMVYEADQSVTLLEVLAEAGGVTNDAGDTIIVTRRAPTFTLVPNPEPIKSAPPGAGDSVEAPGAENSNSGHDEKSAPDPATVPSKLPVKDSAQSPAPGTAVPADQASNAATPGGDIITINLNELIETGDMRNNIPLQAGDVVTVPHAGIVYVLGAVTRPGGFVLANDRTEMTTMKVLALAGGLTKVAKTDHAVIIRKNDQGKQTETPVDLSKILDHQAEDIQMRASDILFVPNSRGKEIFYQALQASLGIGTAVAIYRVAYQ